MPTDRRSLLKGLAAAGLAVSGMGWTHAATATPATPTMQPGPAAPAGGVLTVTQGSALDLAFFAGVRHATGDAVHTRLNDLDSAAFSQLGQLLADGQDTLLVGLLDDASATLVLDLLRSAGGRVLDEHHHRVDRAATVWAQHLGHSLASGVPTVATRVAAGPETRVSFRCMI